MNGVRTSLAPFPNAARTARATSSRVARLGVIEDDKRRRRELVLSAVGPHAHAREVARDELRARARAGQLIVRPSRTAVEPRPPTRAIAVGRRAFWRTEAVSPGGSRAVVVWREGREAILPDP